MSIATAPCDWPIFGCGMDDYGEGDGTDLDCRALESLSPEIRDAIEETAVAHLWNWTGRRFGLCEVAVRPCRRDCDSPSTYGVPSISGYAVGAVPWLPALIAGSWYNLTCGRCGDLCNCSAVEEIGLPGPVDSVVEVVIDGAVLDPSAYRVDDRRLLVRQDGGRWPTCNALSEPVTEEGTWQVTYLRGSAVPRGGQLSAGLLACEMAKAVCGDSSCKLPQRVQSITREGVTTVLLDGFEGLDRGQTGIWFVDSWVTSITRTPRRAKVYSPDVQRPRATTWSAP